MKLGLRYAHHFAHEYDAECPLRQPETALHFNAVRRLAQWLHLQPPLIATARCRGIRCDEHITEQIAGEWDEVVVEARLPSVGPDILLRCGEHHKLAIEVRASNPVSRDKVEAYGRLGLPWIEIEATFIMNAWTPGQPLVLVEHQGGLSTSFCGPHAEVEQRIASAKHSNPPIRRMPAPDLGAPWKYRIVDWYRRTGYRTRLLYWMTRMQVAGGWIIRIIADADTKPQVVVGPIESFEQEYRRAVEEFEDLLLSRSRTLDSPMAWQDASDLPNRNAIYDKQRFPPRRQRAPSSGGWDPDPTFADAQWPADLDA
jgi:hypothetical protein